MQNQETLQKQPWLPSIRIIWFFIAVLLVAIALWIVRVANQGYAFATGFVFATGMVLFFFLSSALVFCIAYIFGATAKGLEEMDHGTESPFGNDQLPDQIVPPSTPDS